MKKITIAAIAVVVLCLMALGGGGAWYVHTKMPVRDGRAPLKGLSAAVTVQYDERGVPHIRADNEVDLYRALGYVHAQDRLFQMEIVRRLAQGELAEVLGPELVETDRLFRTLGIGEFARQFEAKLDPESDASAALLAYLEGINAYQAKHPAPMEFDILGIPKRPFTAKDVAAVSGYMAYSFAAAFKTEPAMTYIRDKLGAPYLAVFDTEGHPEGGLQHLKRQQTALATPAAHAPLRLGAKDWEGLNHLAEVSRNAVQSAGVGPFHGSNAWVIAGKRTGSGKPILAGDPHIGFAVPAVWYEAHLIAPDFELYGHFQALNPMALLGHNSHFGWTMTMFENDDIDLVAEKVNPANSNQVWHQGQWVDLQSRSETIHVKGGADVVLNLRRGPHGPLITDAFKESLGNTPIAMWWAFLETENPILDALYELNRADTLEAAREAAAQIHAPGLNIVWANAEGDIGWWAAAKIPQRPIGVNPMFILDAASGEAEKPGFFNFSFNPQEENPPRGYIVSANQQPGGMLPVQGYYLVPDRAFRMDDVLQDNKQPWTAERSSQLQLDACSGYPRRVMEKLLPMMDRLLTDPNERAFMEPLQKWDGCYASNSVAPSLFSQFSYDLAKAVFEDELGEAQFRNLMGSPALDHALPLLMADTASPWWDNAKTPQKESHFETIRVAWGNTLRHMQELYGTSLLDWSWARTHTLTHVHPLGMKKPFGMLFNVGPYPVIGGRETLNQLGGPIGPAPWAVTFGPSTRRVIDFGAPGKSLGINPVGQSGVPFDTHYADQAERYAEGKYVRQRLTSADILAHSTEKLVLTPAR